MCRPTSIALFSMAAFALGRPVDAQCTTLVATMNSGGQLQEGSNPYFIGAAGELSANGRFLAFVSTATNLVPGDTNGLADVFVRDLVLGTTERVSVATGGLQVSASAAAPSISGDGRLVAFMSSARVHVHDRVTRTTTLASVTSSGTPVYGERPKISADGRFVAFSGYDASFNAGIYLHELATARTTRLLSHGNAHLKSISGDGRFVAFDGYPTQPPFPGDTNATWDVFVHDRITGVTEIASRNSAGVQANDTSRAGSLSLDGRFIAFWSRANNLVPGNWGGIFVRELFTGQVSRLTEGTLENTSTWISADGRYVLYKHLGVLRYDRATGNVERMDLNRSGRPAAIVGEPLGISADGRQVAFSTTASNMVPGGDSNSAIDLFVRDCGLLQVGSAFCFGDGSGVPACACGNVSPELEAGCLHSGPFGMRISAEGSTSLAADDLVLHVTNTPFAATGFFFVGSQSAGPGTPLYDGLLCIGGSAFRFAPQLSSNGLASGAGFAAHDSAGYFVPGSPYFFQYFSVDTAGGNSPCGSGGNFSPGYSVLMTP